MKADHCWFGVVLWLFQGLLGTLMLLWIPLNTGCCSLAGSDLAIDQALNKIMKISGLTWRRGVHMDRAKNIEELCMKEWTEIYLQVSLTVLDLQKEVQCSSCRGDHDQMRIVEGANNSDTSGKIALLLLHCLKNLSSIFTCLWSKYLLYVFVLILMNSKNVI